MSVYMWTDVRNMKRKKYPFRRGLKLHSHQTLNMFKNSLATGLEAAYCTSVDSKFCEITKRAKVYLNSV